MFGGMFFKAGALSLALLLASRLLGLARESAVAATFGTSAMADVAVLMLTLPDWLAGVLAAGALAYVLLPAWAGQGVVAIEASQRQLTRLLWVLGAALALLLVLLRESVVAWLAPGLSPALTSAATGAVVWSAAAVPLALMAALGSARLQHERDFLGLYGANLVVNLALIGAIAAVAWRRSDTVPLLGLGLLLAMCARLVWQRQRQPRGPTSSTLAAAPGQLAVGLPRGALWGWAILSAGLPLALPLAARSIVSAEGEGALATFSYAWKLIELPLVLAIQLVATLALPAVAAAVAAGLGTEEARRPVRTAFALGWTLACAAAAALLVGADALAVLLFGWGRMDPAALAKVADWARVAAWGLLPQSLVAVGLTVLASRQRMARSALLYGFGLLALLALAAAGWQQGADVLAVLNLIFVLIAVGVVASLGADALACMPWRSMGVSLLVLLLVAGLARWSPLQDPRGMGLGLAAAGIAGVLVLGVAWLGAPGLRPVPRR